MMQFFVVYLKVKSMYNPEVFKVNSHNSGLNINVPWIACFRCKAV